MDGVLDPERTIQIGIRGGAEYLWEFSYDSGMTVIHAEEVPKMGVDAVIAPRNRAVGMTETVSRISCGAAENVPFIQVTNIVRTLKELQKNGVWTVGTADGAESSSLYDIDFKGPMALVMGAEGAGLRRLTQETCDLVVQIPMQGKVDCLNVSVATGVCLYEALRQRQSLGSS